MELFSTELILLSAIGLGLAHALDADHVMAVTGLFSGAPGFKTRLAFSMRWAIGHGMALCTIASLVIFFKASIPFKLSEVAESLVGLVLVLIGAGVFWQIFRSPVKLSIHQHGDYPAHIHWHDKQQPQYHGHTATLVGMLHGMAGSAPFLVLVPISDMGATQAYGYVVIFSLGVVLSMLIFGGLLGKGYTLIGRLSERLITMTRIVVATVSIGFGTRLLYDLM